MARLAATRRRLISRARRGRQYSLTHLDQVPDNTNISTYAKHVNPEQPQSSDSRQEAIDRLLESANEAASVVMDLVYRIQDGITVTDLERTADTVRERVLISLAVASNMSTELFERINKTIQENRKEEHDNGRERSDME